jgi:hypothetical protein
MPIRNPDGIFMVSVKFWQDRQSEAIKTKSASQRSNDSKRTHHRLNGVKKESS